MNYKKIAAAMAVCMVFGVFMAACVCLPEKAKHENTKDGLKTEYYDESELTGDGDGLAYSIADREEASKYTIVIDGGHGGIDPGKTKDDVKEKDINLVIAKKLEETLKNAGYNTIMTRTEDEGLYTSAVCYYSMSINYLQRSAHKPQNYFTSMLLFTASPHIKPQTSLRSYAKIAALLLTGQLVRL